MAIKFNKFILFVIACLVIQVSINATETKQSAESKEITESKVQTVILPDENITQEYADFITAIIYGDLEALTKMLKTVPEKYINAVTQRGMTPLEFAVTTEGHNDTSLKIKIIQLLIDNGAKVTRDIIKPIRTLFTANNPTLVKELHKASVEGDLKTVMDILENNKFIDLEIKEPCYKRTALLLAALETNEKRIQEYIQIVKLLIQYGADVNARDNRGFTPLILSARFSHDKTDIAKILLSAGADVNAQNNYGNTALMEAADHRGGNLVTLLLQAGADVNAQNNEGLTALSIAQLFKNNQGIIDMLEEAQSKKAS